MLGHPVLPCAPWTGASSSLDGTRAHSSRSELRFEPRPLGRGGGSPFLSRPSGILDGCDRNGWLVHLQVVWP